MDRPADIQQSGIHPLLYRYALGVDLRDAAMLAECFAPRCRIVGPGYELTGDIANLIVAELTRRFVWTQHNVFNPLYDSDGDSATGVVNCIATHVEQQADGGHMKHDWYIRYHDRLVRHLGQWRFVERRLEVPFISSGPVTPLHAA
jgi:hypothetical protein